MMTPSYLRIRWQHKVTNEKFLRRTGLTTMHTTLSQCRLRWLGHVMRMSDERIPKDFLYSELIVGKYNVGRPRLRYKDVCKRDLKSLSVEIDEWEKLTDDRNKWHPLISNRLREREITFSAVRRNYYQHDFIYFLFIIYFIHYLLILLLYLLCFIFVFVLSVHIKICGHDTFSRFRLIHYYNNCAQIVYSSDEAWNKIGGAEQHKLPQI